MSKASGKASILRSEPRNGSGKGKRRTTQQNGSEAISGASTGHPDRWPYTIERKAGYRYMLIHRDLGEIRAYRTPLGAQRAAVRHHQETTMQTNELETAITDGLTALHARLVEQGTDQEIAAEKIIEMVLRLWPELNDIYGQYDEDDLH